jgi:hypothetical protein
MKTFFALILITGASGAAAQCLQGATVGCSANHVSAQLTGQQQIAPNVWQCTYRTAGYPPQVLQYTFQGGCPVTVSAPN